MQKIRKFILSEEGGIVEWIISTLIIGVGSIAVIMGIAGALNKTSQEGEEGIRRITESGY